MIKRLVAILVCLLLAAPVAAEERVQFNRDVRPILSDKCFQCHGPDAKKRKADLRLDDRAEAVKSKAIVVGKPTESELVRRILSDDVDERMPPATSKLGRLTEQEISTLRKWIEQGAEYENHWSFISLKPSREPLLPAIDDAVRNGLAERGLQLQPEAQRATLIRRLSFDLTGLPPKSRCS